MYIYVNMNEIFNNINKIYIIYNNGIKSDMLYLKLYQ